MSANLYSKVYKSVQDQNTAFKNAEETIAFYLEATTKYMTKALEAAKLDAFEARSDHSDNAIMLLSGIMGAIEQFPNDDQKKMIHLKDFCIGMTNCIVRMNIKHDIEMADSIVKGLSKMAADWRQKAEKREAQEAHTNTTNTPSPQGQIPSKSATPYAGPAYTPQTNLVG